MTTIPSMVAAGACAVALLVGGCSSDDAGSPPQGPTGDGGIRAQPDLGGPSDGGSGAETAPDGAAVGPRDAAVEAPIPSPGAGAKDVIGYWVYTKIVSSGAVTLTRQQPLGNGQGLHKFAYAASGRAFYIYNAPTLSDFDHPGTFEVAGDLLTYHEIMKYSCAHPHPLDEGSNALNPTTTYSYFRKVGNDELWFSVERTTGFNNTPYHKSRPAKAPLPTEGTWIVFQRITEQDFYGKHMIRVCQGSATCVCHADCPSRDLLRAPAPLPACTDTWPYSR